MKTKAGKQTVFILLIIIIVIITGCSTFSVKTPPGMYLSSGDYVPGIKTLGIIQVNKTILAPLFIFDINAVRKDLYNDLLDKAQLVNADGITNIQFYWKISPVTYLSLMILSGTFDFYMEGVAIEKL